MRRLLVLLALGLVGCSAPTQATPTADPFSNVAQQADQAYQQGLELYQAGRRAEALDAFQRARLLSPTDDQRIDDMLQRVSAELTPPTTPTPVREPTASPLPVATPTDVPTAAATALPTAAAPALPAPVPTALPPAAPAPAPAPAPIQPAPVARPRPAQRAVSTPAAASASVVSVPGHPTALDVMPSSSRLFVADQSGSVWQLQNAQPTLQQPFSVSGQPAGLAVDPTNNRLYLALRSPASLSVLDATSGQQLATLTLPGEPGDLRLDSATGLLFVILPRSASVATVDVATSRMLRVTDGLDQVTGVSVDPDTHVVCVSQLNGIVDAIDEASGQIVSRVQLTDAGLTGVACGSGQMYGINTPGRELVVFDPASGDATYIQLDFDPLALALGPRTVSAFVLAADAIHRLDPADASEQSRIALGSLQVPPPSLDAEQLWLRPRLVIDPTTESAYLSDPQTDALALAPPAL